jgi:hypothetical protein
MKSYNEKSRTTWKTIVVDENREQKRNTHERRGSERKKEHARTITMAALFTRPHAVVFCVGLSDRQSKKKKQTKRTLNLISAAAILTLENGNSAKWRRQLFTAYNLPVLQSHDREEIGRASEK